MERQEPKINEEFNVCDKCGGNHRTSNHDLYRDSTKSKKDIVNIKKEPNKEYFSEVPCDKCGGPHKTEHHELFGDTEKIK